MTSPNSIDSAATLAPDWNSSRGESWRTHLSLLEATLAPVDAPLIDALRLDAPCRIADVGCGGGSTSRAIVRAAPSGSVVRGIDISPSLVEMARRRAASEACDVSFEVADVAKAPPPSPREDRLVSRFGTMFFDDPPAAFANLARWLAPGGRFAFAVWARHADNPWMREVHDVVAGVVDVPDVDPSLPGPFRYGEVDRLLALLERSGLSDLEAGAWRGRLPIGGSLPATEAASFALSAFSSFGELLGRAGDSARREAHHRLTKRFAEHEIEGAIQMNACVHVVTGRLRSDTPKT